MAKPTTPILNTGNALASGLVLAIPFTEGSGTPVDFSNTPVTVTPTNAPTWTSGTLGHEMTFVKASSQWIDLGDPAKLQISGASNISIACGFTPTASSYPSQLVAKDSDVGGRAYTFDLFGDRVRIYIDGGGGTGPERRSSSTLSAGTFYNAVATYTYASAGIHMYLNGSLNDGSSFNTGSDYNIPTATTNVNIARRNYTANYDYLDGSISYVYVWNRVLTSQEALALHLNPFQMFMFGGLHSMGVGS